MSPNKHELNTSLRFGDSSKTHWSQSTKNQWT